MEPQPPEPTHLTDLARIDAAAGGLFTAFAFVRSLRKGETRAGKPYFELRLSDRAASRVAKVWSDNARAMQEAGEIAVGDHVKVLFEVETWKGTAQLDLRRIRRAKDGEYDPLLLQVEGHELVADLLCDTLVFDIETVPAVELRRVPPTIAQAVGKVVERNDSDESKVMSLSPYFGQVVSLAVGDGEQDARTQDVTVFVVPPAGFKPAGLPAWIRPVSEPDLLRAFWALAGHAQVVVSYNGRGFDVPFMVARSLIHRVNVRCDLLSNRYSLRPHLDLYQALGQTRGPASLDVVCWALGLQSPKTDMDGSMVATTYAKGDLDSIALYNAGDVRATTGVYQRVRDTVLQFRDDW
jgi:hypothetical protein